MASKKKDVYKALRDQELADIRFLMDHAQGRRFIWRILEKARIFQPSFTKNGNIFFNDGMKNMGCFVLQEIMEECGENFIIMQQEARTSQKIVEDEETETKEMEVEDDG